MNRHASRRGYLATLGAIAVGSDLGIDRFGDRSDLLQRVAGAVLAGLGQLYVSYGGIL